MKKHIGLSLIFLVVGIITIYLFPETDMFFGTCIILLGVIIIEAGEIKKWKELGLAMEKINLEKKKEDLERIKKMNQDTESENPAEEEPEKGPGKKKEKPKAKESENEPGAETKD